MEELIKPRMAEEKRKMVQQVRDDTTEAAIVSVKTKLKEQAEAEAAAREEGEEVERGRGRGKEEGGGGRGSKGVEEGRFFVYLNGRSREGSV